MTVKRSLRAICLLGCAVVLAGQGRVCADLVAPEALFGTGLQRTWELDLKLPCGECVTRIALLDDGLYVLTDNNRVFAVHAPTGIIRWSALLAEPDQVVRGPSHAKDYVFFTTGGTVMVLNRRTGEPIGEPRSIEGVVIEVQHDTATISIGEAHGLHAGDTLQVYRPNEVGAVNAGAAALAELKLTSVLNRKSKGRLTRLADSAAVRPGDRVMGEKEIPLEKVKLPFAASCAAVADEKRIYVGAANQRFYALGILRGFQEWQLMTPNTVVSTPVIDRGQLYFAGLDGRIVSCTKEDRVKNWEFMTEGPVFADVVVNGDGVYVASSDRSLYGLDRVTGKKRWRVRFEAPLMQAPVVALDRVYQSVPDEGLVALDARTGEQAWRHAEGGQFLLQLDRYSYLLSGASHEVLKVATANGHAAQSLNTSMVGFAAASQAEQSIYLVSPNGALACLRSKDAPRLRPEQVVEVLGNDRRAKTAAEVEAAHQAAKAKVPAPAKKTLPESLFEEDWLTSKSTATPVGGHGLAGTKEMPAKPEGKAKPAAKPTAKKAEESEEEEGTADEGAEEPETKESGGKGAKEKESATSKPADEAEDEEEGATSKATSKPAGEEEEEDSGDDDSGKEKKSDEGEKKESDGGR
jgi:outer membrane protein assembly factor BamB